MKKLRPIILTCDNSNRLDTFKIFVESYKKISHTLLSPIVLVGYNDSKRRDEYNFLLNQLEPYEIIEQPVYYTESDIPTLSKKLPAERYRKNTLLYSNTQKVMVKDFPEIALKYSDGNVIFMEDDICFSSKFPRAIKKVSEYIETMCDCITLYSPTPQYIDGVKKMWYEVKNTLETGYRTNPNLSSDDFIHAIYPYDYWGNQSIIFNRRVVEELNKNWEYIENLSYAWDLKWSEFFNENNFRVYATRKSYVQHQRGYSALEKTMKVSAETDIHTSEVYDE
jgi:hypothetical protein